MMDGGDEGAAWGRAAGDWGYVGLGCVEAEDVGKHLGAVGAEMVEDWLGGGGDVVLVLGGAEGAAERVHSALLAAFSPSLWRRLGGVEPCERGLRRLRLPTSVSRLGLGKALEWLYTASTKISRSSAPELWATAAALGLEALLGLLEDWVLEDLDQADLPTTVRLVYDQDASLATKLVVLAHVLRPEVFGRLRRGRELPGLPFLFQLHLLSSDQLPVERESEAVELAIAHLSLLAERGRLTELKLGLLLEQIRWETMSRGEAERSAALGRCVGWARLREALGERLARQGSRQPRPPRLSVLSAREADDAAQQTSLPSSASSGPRSPLLSKPRPRAGPEALPETADDVAAESPAPPSGPAGASSLLRPAHFIDARLRRQASRYYVPGL